MSKPQVITTYVPQQGDGTVGLLRGLADGLYPPMPAPAGKPESDKAKPRRCHPWRKWVDNPSDKQKAWYDPKNRVPHQDRMGLK